MVMPGIPYLLLTKLINYKVLIIFFFLNKIHTHAFHPIKEKYEPLRFQIITHAEGELLVYGTELTQSIP